MTDETYMLVFATASDEIEAGRIASALVEERLAACVNVLSGCKSVYRWEGKLVEEGEALIIIKTRVGLFGRLETRIGELHSYDVPEIIGVELAAVSDGYREFLAASLG